MTFLSLVEATRRLGIDAKTLRSFLVEYGSAGHYVVICPKQGLLAFGPDSPAWFRWLATQSSFRFVGKVGRLTAHHE